MRTRVGFFIAAFVLMAPGLSAAQSRYSTWSDPEGTTASGTPAKGMIEELRALIDEAEKGRAADPVFLRDLRALIGRYDNPWGSEALRDDFRDGDFTRNPAWSVVAGDFWIEKGYGLRSSVTPSASGATATDQRKVSKEELAAAVIGGLLGKALGGKTQQGGSTATTAPARPQVARIHAAARISNGFSLTAEFTSWKTEGAFAIGPYQGARSSGYKVVYHPGQRRSLELVRYSTRGESVVDAFDQPLALEDRRAHVLEWTRTPAGDMTVKIDGKAVISTNDRSFRDAFAGVALENRGGDYVLSRISVFGQ